MGELSPRFRVEMTNIEAFSHMFTAVNAVTRAALDARRELLNVGFTDAHLLCKELDRTAAQFTDAHTRLLQQVEDEVLGGTTQEGA